MAIRPKQFVIGERFGRELIVTVQDHRSRVVGQRERPYYSKPIGLFWHELQYGSAPSYDPETGSALVYVRNGQLLHVGARLYTVGTAGSGDRYLNSISVSGSGFVVVYAALGDLTTAEFRYFASLPAIDQGSYLVVPVCEFTLVGGKFTEFIRWHIGGTIIVGGPVA